jgi:diguanylate cyclase (GGDEF)-like protein
MTPSLSDRISALRTRVGGLAWLYTLAAIPVATDLLETGSMPVTARGWITEAVVGAIIAALVTKVRHDHGRLESQAQTDGLTGLKNRHVFKTFVDIECARSQRSGAPMSIVYLDLNRFKQINDRFGHAAGDQVLRQFAAAIRQAVRVHVDGAFRLGGDEFALVLPSSTKAQATAVVERLRAFCSVQDPSWSVGAVDFSAGIAEREPGETSAGVIARSDQAMYRQKAQAVQTTH